MARLPEIAWWYWAAMPWNRTRPLTLRLVRRAYLTPPVQGSILAALSQPG